MDSGFTEPIFAATIDLRYRLPPPQEIIYSPAILVASILLIIAALVLVFLYQKSVRKERKERRQRALWAADNMMAKRGASDEQRDCLRRILEDHPRIDPEASTIVYSTFTDKLLPVIIADAGRTMAESIEKRLFPPRPVATKIIGQDEELKTLAEATQNEMHVAADVAMQECLRPGIPLRLVFFDMEGTYKSVVVFRNESTFEVTIPAHPPELITRLKPGMEVEGFIESGTKLMAFTTSVVKVESGDMPLLVLEKWRDSWQVRQREAVRLPISLPVHFQHMPTQGSHALNLGAVGETTSQLVDGYLCDLSLGGCSLHTAAKIDFQSGDLVRLTTSLLSSQPPATLLGAIVDSTSITLQDVAGVLLRVQFLALDDISQRLLAKAVYQHQESIRLNEWVAGKDLLGKRQKARLQQGDDAVEGAGQ